MTLQPFIVDYDRTRGMQPELNGDPALVTELEILGIGMEVEGPWAQGGPVVWKRRDGTTVIGWIRGLAKGAHDRAGGCKAWGIEASADEEIRRWPALWDMLKAEPASGSLSTLVRSFRAAVPPRLPPLRNVYAGLLSEAYRTNAGRNGTFVIPLESPDDIPALAWFWLLGPEDPLRATLGPPRKDLAAVSPRLTYAGQIDAIPTLRPSSFVSEQIFDAVGRGDLKAAVKAAEELRSTPLHQLSSKLDPPRRAQPARPNNEWSWNSEGPMAGSPLRRGRQEFDNPVPEEPALPARAIVAELRNWLTPALSVIQILLLFLIMGLLMQRRKVVAPPGQNAQTAALPANTETVGTQTAAPTATDTMTTTSPEPLPEVTGAALLSGLHESRQGVTYAASLTTWIKAPHKTFSRADIARARTAALQLYFMTHQCAKSSEPIDGVIGPSFYDGIHCLARNGNALDVFKNDQSLIEWLQSAP